MHVTYEYLPSRGNRACVQILATCPFPTYYVKCDAGKMSHHQFSLDSLRHHNSSAMGPDVRSVGQHFLSGNLQNLGSYYSVFEAAFAKGHIAPCMIQQQHCN